MNVESEAIDIEGCSRVVPHEGQFRSTDIIY